MQYNDSFSAKIKTRLAIMQDFNASNAPSFKLKKWKRKTKGFESGS